MIKWCKQDFIFENKMNFCLHHLIIGMSKRNLRYTEKDVIDLLNDIKTNKKSPKKTSF